jgi:phage FluMu gp28-like protein
MTASAIETKGRAAAKAAAFSPLDLLLPYQRRWVTDEARFKIGALARQTGKSFCTACEAVRSAFTDPGAQWVCLSAGERQALEWLEKAKEWAQAFRLAVEHFTEDREFAEALLKSAEIRFGNGSRILAIPANPATARGYSANIILDEFAYHEDPDKIWAAMFPAVTNPLAGTFMTRLAAAIKGERCDQRRELKVRVVSTFNGKGNKFFELWEKAAANGYSAHAVTIEDAARDGLPVDVETLRQGLDDPDAFAQEYMCVPCDTSNVLLPYDLIARAESADATEFFPDWSGAAGRRIFLGVDFGRQHDPTVCWALERIGDVLWTREVLVLAKMDTPDQQDILRARVKCAERVSFDYTGPGVGLGDFLAREHGRWDPARHEFGRIELCTFTAAFKREIFPKLRRAFEAPTRVRAPISRAVREDLHAMQQTVHNGQYDYWAPRTREGHSDRCTALALAVRAAGDEDNRCGAFLV